MITTKGNIIEINGKTEWLLFNRLSKKIHPVDFLYQTDIFIQFPNFLFTVSFFILILTDLDLWVMLTIPALLYIAGQILINLRFGVKFLKLIKIPVLAFPRFNFVIMLGSFITGFFFIGWWTLLIIPSYIASMALSLLTLTSKDKRRYQSEWNRNPDWYSIFKNNAFLLMYKYYATDYNLLKDISPTPEETAGEDWLKPYTFMRMHWAEIESHFNRKAKVYWRLYLQLDQQQD
jgi:hypothetical protein